MTNVNLRNLPEDVRESAIMLANAESEELVGWKAITEPVHGDPSRVQPIRYMVITDKGYYEVLPNGDVVRAAVLHGF